MKIIKVQPRGYCKGVVRAINMVKTARESYQQNIYILGMIVHNNYVKAALEEYHIISLDTSKKSKEAYINEIDEGLIIFTAHGIEEEIVNLAKAKGLDILDASCIDVLKTQKLIKEKIDNHYVLYISKTNHPEAQAVLSISNKIYPITSIDDVNNLQLPLDAPVFITNQTTMSIYETKDIATYIQKRFINSKFELEVCDATKVRQEAIMQLDANVVDVLIIVGDVKSNNSNMLVNINKNIKKRLLVNSVDDIDPQWFNGNDCIAISSGASTPTYLTNQVIAYLQQLNINDESTYIKPQIEIKKIL